MDTYLYENEGSLYVNLTNACTNDCTFCERNKNSGAFGYRLWLEKEPTADEVIACLREKDLSAYGEVVFCGFGEPIMRLDVLLEVAKYCRKEGIRTRINTNGQGNLIYGRDIAPELKPWIDTVSISLNNGTAEKYQETCRSAFGEAAFAAILEFAASCVRQGIRTVMTVVDVIPAEEIEQARALAESVGAEFRVRKYY